MPIPQVPSPLYTLTASSTYDADWFSGSTYEAKVQAAINAAAADGAERVLVKRSYNASLVTFNNAVRMVREGGAWNVFDLKAYGANGGGITDDTPSFLSATAACSAAGGGVVHLPSGTYLITATITIPSFVVIRGEGSRNTVIKATTAIRMLQSLGQYASEGSTRIFSPEIHGLKLDSTGVATQGYYAKGCINIRLHDVYFSAFTTEAVYFDQVWDSYLTQLRFQDHTQAVSNAQVLLRFGSGDNTNQIHFHNCVWETYKRPAVRITSGAGSSEKVNEIFFYGAKFESVHPDVNHIDLGDFRTVGFMHSTFTIARTNSGTPTYVMISNAGFGLTVTDTLVEYFQTGSNEYSFFAPTGGDNFNFVNVRVQGTAPNTLINVQSGSPYITAVGITTNDDPNTDIITGGDAAKINRIYKTVQITAANEEPTLTVRRTGSGARSIDWGRIDSSGNAKLIDTTGGDVVIAQSFPANQWQWQRAEAHLPTALTYGATVSTDAAVGNIFTITATDTSAFTVSNPTNTANGVLLEYHIINSSGGAMGAITWGSNFRLAGAFTNPANGQRRTITFRREGSSLLREVFRTTADQANA